MGKTNKAPVVVPTSTPAPVGKTSKSASKKEVKTATVPPPPPTAPRRKRAKKGPAVEYVAKPGSRLSKADAVMVGSTIDSIAKEKGKVQPSDLLDSARVPTSPIHHLFEWDDSKAAEAHRLSQASYLIRSIEVKFIGSPDDVPRTRGFEIVRTDEGSSGYVPIQTIVQNVGYTSQLVDRAKADLKTWAHKYATLRKVAELAGIFESLEAADVIAKEVVFDSAAE